MTLKADDIRLMQDAVRGCLAGVAIGDALGMPWETFTHQKIRYLTGQLGVTGLQDLPAKLKREYRDARELDLGETTDDWQLTQVVADSLIRCQGFSLYDQALAHVAALERSTLGWGNTTRREVRNMKSWFDSRGKEGRRPDLSPKSEEGRGNGNGVIMKVAPLACAAALLKQSAGLNQGVELLIQWVLALGRLTHDHDASVAALLVADLIRQNLMYTPLSSKPHGLKRSIEAMKMAYLIISANPSVAPSSLNEKGTSSCFLKEDKCLDQQTDPASQALPTAAFTISTFLRHPTDFRGAVLEAINAGGDTDTNAAIVGALVGANVGLNGIPTEWLELVPNAKTAICVADQLVRVFLNS